MADKNLEGGCDKGGFGGLNVVVGNKEGLNEGFNETVSFGDGLKLGT